MPDALTTPLAATETLHDRYPLLARPMELGGVRFRNRVVHASMTTRYANAQRVTDRLILYYGNRGEGGAAGIVTEPLAVLPWQDPPNKIRCYDDSELDGLKRWADGVERFDCRLLGQIQDPGRGMHHKGRRAISYSASSLPDDLSWTVPHALEEQAVGDIVSLFAEAAHRLQRAGFSGVEMSCGHGHLFHQFLSPHSNARQDKYGGSLENRVRFVAETIRAIRAACGRPFVIAVKLPGDDGVEGGVDPDEAERITRAVVALGEVDALTWCQGSHHRTLEDHIPDMHWPRAPFNALIKRLRASAGGIPVAALGRLVEPVQAEQALQEQVGDFVQIGRALITEPAWVNKALAGKEHEARWCVSCNTCWTAITEKSPIVCDNNPRVGLPGEAGWWPSPAVKPKRIVIVGAGVAGLEAAWIAAARGHQVTVFGASATYGGKAALLARLPDSDQISSVYDYQIVQASKAQVRFEYGVTATVEDILGLQPDAVVLATGGTMNWPKSLPDEWREEGYVQDLRATAEMLLEGFPKQPGTALIYDHDATMGTYAAAELMVQMFDRVAIATPRAMIAGDEGLVVQQGILKRMARLGVDVIPQVQPSAESALEDGVIALDNVWGGKAIAVEDVALFTYSTSRHANDALAAPLRAAGLPVHLVGDAFAPRYLLHAVADGHRVGNEL